MQFSAEIVRERALLVQDSDLNEEFQPQADVIEMQVGLTMAVS